MILIVVNQIILSNNIIIKFIHLEKPYRPTPSMVTEDACNFVYMNILCAGKMISI